MDSESRATTEDLLAQLADELGEVELRQARATVEYRRRGKIFASASEGAVELRLGAEIAEAAARTPGASVSDVGQDWLRFAPHEWDRHASDRLAAWFRVAWRAAGRSMG